MTDELEANLISGFIEFTLFGIFAILSPASLLLLIRRHRVVLGASYDSAPSLRRWIETSWGLGKSPLVLANVLLMLTVTAHFCFSSERLVLAIVRQGDREQSIAFLIDQREMTQVARLFLLVTTVFIGDVVITYRVWLVCGRNICIAFFPMLTVAGMIVSGCGMIRQSIVSHSNGGSWIIAICVMSVCTNVYGTVVIAYRVWASNRLLKSTGVIQGGRTLLESIAIFIESAALWTFGAIFFLISRSYLAESGLVPIVVGAAPTVIGVTFMLITLRVGLGWGHETWAPATTAIGMRMPASSGVGRQVPSTIRTEDFRRPQASLVMMPTVDLEEGVDIGKCSIVEEKNEHALGEGDVQLEP